MSRRSWPRWPTLIEIEAALIGGLTLLALASGLWTMVDVVADWF